MKSRTSKETTCGNCQHAVASKGGFVSIVHCQKTGDVIPHETDYSKAEVILWRIPVDCPRPDSEVHKSEVQAVKSDWVKVGLFDLQAKFSKGARHAG